MSSARRGAYYKARTKRWLIAQGWQVADMEVMRSVYLAGREPFFVKHDQFASDLVAIRPTTIVFIQVKGGKRAQIGNFPAARRAFAAYPWPPFVKRWVIAWPLRAREPRIVEMAISET